jgi:hypothetical protein
MASPGKRKRRRQPKPSAPKVETVAPPTPVVEELVEPTPVAPKKKRKSLFSKD